MTELVVTEIDENLVRALEEQAKADGLSIEEEHRKILRAALRLKAAPQANEEGLQESFVEHLLNFPKMDEEYDWVFDRHDLRYGQAILPEGEDFKAHLLALGEFGDDLDIEMPRSFSGRNEIEL